MFTLPQWIALLPPLIVLTSTIITRHLLFSLSLGLFSGALIATTFRPLEAAALLLKRVTEQITDIDMLYVYLFLICIGILISLLDATGAAKAAALHIRKKINTTPAAEKTTFWLSLSMSIDDYLNCLTVGYVMRPLTDSVGIAREKLAYLLHTFAGPLVVLIPISTWGTFITSQLDSAGIKPTAEEGAKIIADPFWVYLQSIPYIFYSLFAIASAWYIIKKRISFGPMQRAEFIAQQSVHTTLQQDMSDNKAHLSDLLIPLAILVVSVGIGMLYAGGYWLMGGTHTLLETLRNNDQAFAVLGISSMITVAASISLSLLRKQIRLRNLGSIAYEGVQLMIGAITLIILASSLGSILRIDLETGQYLASLLLGHLPIMLLPILMFLVGTLTSTLIGTAWGTIALLFPIAIPMAITMAESAPEVITTILVPTIGALLSGALFGDHTSPIASAGVMAATSAGCKPIAHVHTSYLYAIPALLGAGIAYLLCGIYMQPNLLAHTLIRLLSCLLVGLSTTLAILHLMKRLWSKRHPLT